MTKLRYVTHPEVTVDPNVAVTHWNLSPVGIARAHAIGRQPWAPRVGRIVSSNEAKAVQTATILAEHLGLTVEIREALGENDRSATGFVAPPKFEVLTDAFFAEPARSVEGWERAVDAQARIVAALADLLVGDAPADVADGDVPEPDAPGADVVVVGHGGVGTLWYCALTGQAIDRRHDQPGQGHYFTVDRATGRVEHPWRPVDHFGES